MAIRPNIDLTTIPGLEDVANELATLVHVAKSGNLRHEDDKVVRCLKSAIIDALEAAQLKGINLACDHIEAAIAITRQP